MTNEHATEQAPEAARDSLPPTAPEQHRLEQHLIEEHIVEEQLADVVRTEQGNLCKIIVHNDDVTPYDYVIDILGDLFMLSEELADHVAWTAHMKGVAVVVVRPRAEAEKLVKVAHGRARSSSYPLTFSLEQE